MLIHKVGKAWVLSAAYCNMGSLSWQRVFRVTKASTNEPAWVGWSCMGWRAKSVRARAAAPPQTDCTIEQNNVWVWTHACMHEFMSSCLMVSGMHGTRSCRHSWANKACMMSLPSEAPGVQCTCSSSVLVWLGLAAQMPSQAAHVDMKAVGVRVKGLVPLRT
jgi:hypothetical protein